MARQVSISKTHTSVVTSFDSTNSTYYAQLSGYPAENGIGDGSGTYGAFNLTRGANAITDIYYNFDCSAIPDNATITSVTCSERVAMSTTNTNYVKLANLQLCAGTTAKGSSVSIMSTTAQYYSVNGGNSWTVAEVKNCKIRGHAERGSRNTSSQYAIRMFGGTLTVNYTVNGMAYTITATSSVNGETVSPATQELMEGETAEVIINVTDLTDRALKDNDVDVTSSLVYNPPDNGGANEQYPASYSTGGSGTISGTRYQQAIGHGVNNPSSATSTDYTAQGGTTAMIYYHFDFSSLPDTATINSISVQVRYKIATNSASATTYPQTVNTYLGTTAKGTATTLTATTDTIITLTPGTWTLAQLKDDPRVGLQLSYKGSLITGITWIVNYSANVPAYYKYTLTNLSADHTVNWIQALSDKLFVKLNNVWRQISKIYHKENGVWVEKNLSYISDSNITYLQQGSLN